MCARQRASLPQVRLARAVDVFAPRCADAADAADAPAADDAALCTPADDDGAKHTDGWMDATTGVPAGGVDAAAHNEPTA